jgi:hypothetical protein
VILPPLVFPVVVMGFSTATAVCIRRVEMTKSIFVTVFSSDSTVVEHLAYHSMVKGLSPATVTWTGKEKMIEVFL